MCIRDRLSYYDGGNPVLTGAVVSAKVLLNGADDTANWAISKVESNITGTLVGGVYTLTGVSADSGYVDITFTKTNYTSRTLRCVITKIRQGILEQSIASIPNYVPLYKGTIAYSGLVTTSGISGDTITAYATASGQCGIYKLVSGIWGCLLYTSDAADE